ncbi:AlpA family transcriptional regulator [Acetobacter malorum]|uniref:helix-turn-helix transcriptional regulator n=1 Tax=Acetobacter malorum TaxID=178901 RepID=UPI00248E589D|nr:AlpA family phage regulatory protein [Acetobacter malorum]
MGETLERPLADSLLTVREVSAKVGLSRASIYNHMHRGIFPKPTKLRSGAVRWKSSTINRWIANPEAETAPL